MNQRVLFSSIRLVLLSLIVLGLAYSMAVFAVGQLFFSYKANGSLVTSGNKIIGSSLIGQNFTSPKYFQGRPSATTPTYNAEASGPSNYGPTSPLLLEEVKSNLERILKENPGISASQVPPELVESSASGLDPDISPASAYLQVPRVARINHISATVLRNYIRQNTTPRFLDIFGTAYVNVLNLNMEVLKLDHKH